MDGSRQTPYLCHILICTNDRQGTRKSCADGQSVEIRSLIKQGVTDRGWKPGVRVSQSGCLGVCDQGPNVMIYPQCEWFSGMTKEDVPHLLDRIASILETEE